MMLADAIGNVSLDSISNYAALDGHGGPLVAGGGDLVERSIRMGFEANGRIVQSAVGERQRFAADGDGYVILGRTSLV
jgi:hypothetical protein